MKPLNPAVARRIVALDDAKAQLADLEAALKIDKPTGGYTARVVSLQVMDTCESGGDNITAVRVDMVTGRKLFPMLRQLIDSELQALGVQP